MGEDTTGKRTVKERETERQYPQPRNVGRMDEHKRQSSPETQGASKNSKII